MRTSDLSTQRAGLHSWNVKINFEILGKDSLQTLQTGLCWCVCRDFIPSISSLKKHPFRYVTGSQRQSAMHQQKPTWASPGFPDTSNDMMCLGGKHAKDEKSIYGRVQTGSGEAGEAT
ncbi:hypothetical protein, partial [Acidovorax sp. SUPP1855]|uniref:hypothetical protein n=1 Tax=Acidovorax sp. SUPP1855 TaxID=431774 RepID=UPI0024E0B38F